MSRLDPNGDKPKNPAKYFIEWSSKEKSFQYYKKYNEDEIKNGVKGVNIKVPLPLRFLVLDILYTIKGFNNTDKSSYWSNEVKDKYNDVITVRTKKGIKNAGIQKEMLYQCKGSKYCESVYIAIKENEKYVLANLQLFGSGVADWIRYTKENKNSIYSGAVEVSHFENETKGDVNYNKPVFKKIKASQEAEDKAIELTKELQEYLKQYFSFSNNNTEQEENIKSDDFSENIEKEVEDDFVPKSDDLPF